MFFFIIILLFYAALLTHLAIGILKINKTRNIETSVPTTTFSLIIPFRNEASNLPILLESISKIDYPKDLFEVILIDDESNDDWKLEKVNYPFQISQIPNSRKSNSPKKDAIETAIPIAKFDWIVTTDADCIVPINWLTIFNAAIEKKGTKMLVGSVLYQDNTSFLHHFQYNDMLSLQGVTAGSFGIQKGFMCNGANFAYEKELFKNLNGYDGNNSFASGDDVFLLQKALKKEPAWIDYLGNQSVVYTNSCNTWEELLSQRVRWASKTSAYQTVYPKILGSIVFLTNLGFVFSLIYLFFNCTIVYQVIYFILLKFGIDYMFLKFSSAYFQIKIKNYIPSFMLYPFFTIGVVLLTFKGKYKWKDRKLT